MIQLDVEYMFQAANGPRGLLNLLDRHAPGHDVPYPTVQMWRQRGSIPTRWLPSVLYALARSGHPIVNFFVDTDETPV